MVKLHAGLFAHELPRMQPLRLRCARPFVLLGALLMSGVVAGRVIGALVMAPVGVYYGVILGTFGGAWGERSLGKPGIVIWSCRYLCVCDRHSYGYWCSGGWSCWWSVGAARRPTLIENSSCRDEARRKDAGRKGQVFCVCSNFWCNMAPNDVPIRSEAETQSICANTRFGFASVFPRATAWGRNAAVRMGYQVSVDLRLQQTVLSSSVPRSPRCFRSGRTFSNTI